MFFDYDLAIHNIYFSIYFIHARYLNSNNSQGRSGLWYWNEHIMDYVTVNYA